MASNKTGNSKDRTTNFNKDETAKLTCLLRDYAIITSKKTDNASNQQKDAAWRSLAEKFNSDALVYRSIKQLQQKFNNMKKMARKEMSAEKSGRRQTGGGPPPPKPSETTEWLNTIMGESISGLPAIYDSDVLIECEVTDDKLNKSGTSTVLEFIEHEKLDIGGTESPSILSSKLMNIEVLNDNNIETDADLNKCDMATTKANNNISFDTSTPKSLLRKPISKQLSNCNSKRKQAYTPLEVRKRIVTHFNEKKDLLFEKRCREETIKNYAQEEHQQNLTDKAEKHIKEMSQMDEKHFLFIKQQTELHELEVEFKKKIQALLLEKVRLEIEQIKN